MKTRNIISIINTKTEMHGWTIGVWLQLNSCISAIEWCFLFAFASLAMQRQWVVLTKKKQQTGKQNHNVKSSEFYLSCLITLYSLRRTFSSTAIILLIMAIDMDTNWYTLSLVYWISSLLMSYISKLIETFSLDNNVFQLLAMPIVNEWTNKNPLNVTLYSNQNQLFQWLSDHHENQYTNHNSIIVFCLEKKMFK